MQMSQGRKKLMARPGLEPRTSHIPFEHSNHWATEPHGRPVTISPCLIRFVPESARNHAWTDETVPLLLAAQARTHTEPPNVTGEEKAHGPTRTRTQDLSQTVRVLWPLSYRAKWSTCDNFPYIIRFVPESAWNHAGTDESVSLLLAARARTHTEPPNVTGEEKAHGPTGTRTQDLSQTVRALWPLSYRATRSTCDTEKAQ